MQGCLFPQMTVGYTAHGNYLFIGTCSICDAVTEALSRTVIQAWMDRHRCSERRLHQKF